MNDLPPMILGTRGSALALAQAHLTLHALRARHPQGRFEIKEIKTTGDRRLDLSLTRLAPGGHGYEETDPTQPQRPRERLDPGLFTKELETELLAGTISLAIHSLKDLPTAMPVGLTLAAVLPRADTADVLIYKSLDGPAQAAPVSSPFPSGSASAFRLPPSAFAPPPSSFILHPSSFLPMLGEGAVVATSSLRRQRQLRWRRPDLRAEEVRGNVGTRLRKLRDRADWTGLILAKAGLERLGHAEQLRAGYLETPEAGRFAVEILGGSVMLPAVGQGAIALQARADDRETLAALAEINCETTFAAVRAERELLRLLGGGCQMPLGASTEIDPKSGQMRLRAVLFRAEGEPPRLADAIGDVADPLAVAEMAARHLLG